MEALFQLRDGSGTLLPFAARGAFLSVMKLPRCLSCNGEGQVLPPPFSPLRALKTRYYAAAVIQRSLHQQGKREKRRKKDRNRQRGNCLPLVLSLMSDALMPSEGSESKSQQVLDTGVLGYRFHFQQQSCFFSCLAFPLCCMCFVENSVWCLKINHQIKTEKRNKKLRSFIVYQYSQWVKCRALSDTFTSIVSLYHWEACSLPVLT